MYKRAFSVLLMLTSYLCQNTCKLTQAAPSKAVPSLIQCYANNDNTCCSSQQDLAVQSQLIYDSSEKGGKTGLFTSNCASKDQMTKLLSYLCFGCHMSSMHYDDNNTILLCRSYVESIWKADVDGPTTAYDLCGMWWGPSGAQTYVLPSVVLFFKQKWANALAFLNDNIPANYDDTIYSVTVVDDRSGNPLCFSFAYKIGLHLVFNLVFQVVFILL